MNIDEMNDLEKLKNSQQEHKLRAIEYMLHCHKHGIEHSGYKTFESLCSGTVRGLQNTLNKLVDAHIKKYPDDK